MAFKKDLTPLTKKGSVTVHKGKGSTQERLPSRGALSTLTSGSPVERNFNDYAKATPNIQGMAGGGPVVSDKPWGKPRIGHVEEPGEGDE